MADTKENGGPAFPGDEAHDVFNEDAGEYQTRWIWTGGMSLRDYFAAKAMVGMTNQLNRIHADVFNGYDNPGALRVIADAAYRVADAMLKERG